MSASNLVGQVLAEIKELVDVYKSSHVDKDAQDDLSWRLHRLVTAVTGLDKAVLKVEKDLVAEALVTARYRLQADQMSSQHSMQAKMNSEARESLSCLARKLERLPDPVAIVINSEYGEITGGVDIKPGTELFTADQVRQHFSNLKC